MTEASKPIQKPSGRSLPRLRLPGLVIVVVAAGTVSAISEMVLLATQPQGGIPLLAGIALAASGLVVATGLLAWRRVAKLAVLHRLMTRNASGETASRVPFLARRDEIGEIARAVQALTGADAQYRLLLQWVEAASDEQELQRQDTAREIDDFCTTVAGVMSALAFSSTTMRSFAAELTDAANKTQDQTSATVSDAVESSQNLANVAAAVEQMSASVGVISERVSHAAQIAGEAVNGAAATDQTMRGLAEAVHKISAIAGLIRDIANRTNLLALNATIEAARAGEAGRGFAVVASEVKMLATQTARATEEIGGQITGIQAATEQSLRAMRGVGETIRQVSEVAAEIEAAIDEQRATAADIAARVQMVATSTTAAVAALGNVSESTMQAQMTSSVVLEAASEISTQSEALREEVADFLTGMEATGTGRRRYQRFTPVGLMAMVELDGAGFEAPVIDISCGGASLISERLADAGTPLTVALPGLPGPVHARVVRATGEQMTVKFAQDAETLALLEREIPQLVARRAA